MKKLKSLKDKIELLQNELDKLTVIVKELEETAKEDRKYIYLKRVNDDGFECYIRIIESTYEPYVYGSGDEIIINPEYDAHHYEPDVMFFREYLVKFNWIPSTKEEFNDARERVNKHSK